MRAIFCLIALSFTLSTANATDIDVVDQRYIDQLTRGGNISIKQAAQSIYNTGEQDTEVLDVAAEVLLQKYPTAIDQDIDALAWVSRALGNSRNPRYHNTLKEVANSNAHSKLRKYAKKALDQVGGPSGEQYKKGTVDLAALRLEAAKPAAAATAAGTGAAAGEKGKLDIIRPGMSMQEVYDLVGHPTATSRYQTGKAWIPFNYGAKDLARTLLLYKGQGRIVCSHDGYSSTSRVVEVILDPNETGYP